MASPQAENGHVDIANELIEALARYRINGEAMQCLLVVFRKTYGWKKTEDEISLSQFAAMTGLKRPNVARAVAWLVSKKILGVIKEDTTFANKYRFNKDFDTWVPVSKKSGVIRDDNRVVSKMIRVGVSPMIHTKDTSTKEKRMPNPEVRIIQVYLIGAFEKKYGFPPEINYAAVGKRLKELLKKYNVDALKEMIDWFLTSPKSAEHPTPAAALSTDTVQRWQVACPEVQ